MEKKEESGQLVKGLGILSATNIVIGSMIGSGIFLAPSLMAGFIQTPGLLLLLWLTGGLLSVCGSLSIAELASAFPHSGGQYVFLKECYSPLWGFLFGWTLFLVIQSGFVAAVSIAFSKYLGVFFPFLGEENKILSFMLFNKEFSFSSAQMASVFCIALLTFINIRGVRAGALVQNIFTISKVGALLILVGAAFLIGSGDFKNFFPIIKPILGKEGLKMGLFAAMAVAMSKALFAYDAWNSVTFVAEEIKSPQKNLPRSLAIGTGLTTFVYIITTMAYFYLIPVSQMAVIKENRVGAAVAEAIMGNFGLTFITIAILISTFGCVNGLILSGSRVIYAMAKDKIFFKKNGLVHPQYHTPHYSLIYQGIWSCILVLSGSYNDLLTYTAFASLLANVMTVFGLFKLRRQRPDLPRPYKVTGYPLVPLLYLLIAYFFIIYIIIGDPKNSGKGLFIILTGLPVYFYWKRKQKK